MWKISYTLPILKAQALRRVDLSQDEIPPHPPLPIKKKASKASLSSTQAPMTHFGVVTMPLLYTCKSSDNYYSVFETSVLISSNIPFLDNAHPHNWALWSRSNLREKQHPYYKYSNRHPHCWGWGFNDVNYPQSPFVCKISFYFCLTCEQALAFVFFPLMAQPPYYTFNSHL